MANGREYNLKNQYCSGPTPSQIKRHDAPIKNEVRAHTYYYSRYLPDFTLLVVLLELKHAMKSLITRFFSIVI